MEKKRLLLVKFCRVIIAILLISLSLPPCAACTSTVEKRISSAPPAHPNPAEKVSFVAEVSWISLEGGFYGLVAEDGRKFFPLNLPEEFKKKGLKIRVKGNIRKDIATIQMWGMPFEIREIEIHGE